MFGFSDVFAYSILYICERNGTVMMHELRVVGCAPSQWRIDGVCDGGHFDVNARGVVAPNHDTHLAKAAGPIKSG